MLNLFTLEWKLQMQNNKRNMICHENNRYFHCIFTMRQALYLNYFTSSSWQLYEIDSIIFIPIFRGENWGLWRLDTYDIMQLRHKAHCFRLSHQLPSLWAFALWEPACQSNVFKKFSSNSRIVERGFLAALSTE